MRNRDIEKIQNAVAVMRAICATEEKKEWIESRLYSITQHYSETPGGGGIPHGLEGPVGMLEEIKEKLGEKIAEYYRAELVIQKIYDKIKSPEMLSFVIRIWNANRTEEDVAEELCLSVKTVKRIKRDIEESESMEAYPWEERIAPRNQAEKGDDNN